MLNLSDGKNTNGQEVYMDEQPVIPNDYHSTNVNLYFRFSGKKWTISSMKEKYYSIAGIQKVPLTRFHWQSQKNRRYIVQCRKQHHGKLVLCYSKGNTINGILSKESKVRNTLHGTRFDWRMRREFKAFVKGICFGIIHWPPFQFAGWGTHLVIKDSHWILSQCLSVCYF